MLYNSERNRREALRNDHAQPLFAHGAPGTPAAGPFSDMEPFCDGGGLSRLGLWPGTGRDLSAGAGGRMAVMHMR